MTETANEPKNRVQSLLETRQGKMDALFKGKKYKIAKEIKLEGEDRFVTPFGNKGRNGFALQLVSGEPAVIDDKKLDKFIIGETMLKQVHTEYDAIEGGLPEKPRKRRTKEQKAADDAKAAEEKAAKAAAKEAEKVNAG